MDQNTSKVTHKWSAIILLAQNNIWLQFPVCAENVNFAVMPHQRNEYKIQKNNLNLYGFLLSKTIINILNQFGLLVHSKI